MRALRDGDERVFSELVERWSGVMLRLALSHVENRAIAEEVVQDAWLTVLRSFERFERRSTLRTWVLGIVEWESIEGFADFFMARFGPIVTARTMLGDRFVELRQRVIEIWRKANQATDGMVRLPQEYLLSIIRL